MEGMPRLPMLTPEFKFSTASLPAEFSTKIKEYILMHYQDDPSKYDAAINEMMSLRAQFGRLVPDVETVCQMKRYYAQLTMMKSRFPMEEGDPIKIPFSWLDKAMDMPSSAVYEDVNFELTSVMFNIGAIHAAIAANETRIDLDSIKNAFTHFQCAAFPFQHIRDRMNAAKYSSIDFEPSLLTWYVNILLAQAQECILEKSLIDHRKNTVIAKIAVYLRDIYMSCHEHLESSGLSDIISSSKYREWLRTCDVKAELYGVVAMVHLGEQADADKKMGDRLAYYQIASEHVKAAAKLVEKDKRESLRQAVVFATDVVVAKETNAKKENDFIYHERIPRREELTMVEGVSMVKPIGFEPTDRSIAGDDLFAALLPMNVLKSVSMYSEEKAKLKRAVFDRVEAKDRELDDYMLSLQLDEINLDKSVDELKLPEMLLERSATFNAQPDAFPDLLDKLQRVGHCAIEADHKLDDLHNRLSAIDSPDLTSDAGFEAIKKELERISDHHTKARTNNAQLQRAIAAHSENLRVLAMPLGELNRRISGPAVKPSETAEGAQLKRMLCKTEEMRKQRSQLLDTFSKDLENDDITAKCLAEKDLDNTDLYSRELKKHDEVIQLIDMNLAAQVKILAALTEANASFADCRRQVMELNRSRADQVLALTAAYDVYVDVLQKADEGLKFYSTLFSLTRTLDEAMEGIENAYEEEKAAKEKEKRQLEERARELRMAREAREAMEQFRNQPIDSPHSSALVSPLDFPPSAADGPKNVGGARLKDYMAYYRAKIAGHMPPSSQQHPTGIISSSSSAFSSCAQGLGLPGTLPPPQSPYVNATGIAPPAAALSMSMPQGYQSTAGNAVTASSRMAQNSPSIQPYVGVGSATVGPLGTPSTGRSVVAPAALQASLQHPLQMPSQPAVSNFLPTHTSHQPSIALFGSLSQPLTATSIVQPPSQPAVGVGYYVQSVGHNAHAFQHASNTAGSAKQLAQNEAQMPHAPAAVQNAVQMPQNSMQYAQHFAVSVCPSGTASQQQSQLSDLGSQTVQPQKTVATTQLVNGCISALPFAPNAISLHMQSNVAHNMQNSTAPITAQTPSTASCAMMNSGITLQNRTHPLSPVVGAVNASSGTQFTELPITSVPQTAISSATSITHSAHPSALSPEIPSNMQGGVIPDSFITMQMSDSSSAFAQVKQQTCRAVVSQRSTCDGSSDSNLAAINVSAGSFMPQSHPAVVPKQFLSPFAPSAQGASDSGVLSPWHQSLLTNSESLIYGNGRLLNQSPSMTQHHRSSGQPPNAVSGLAQQPSTAMHQSAYGVQQTAPYASTTQNIDLMSSPLNANLPAPLLPCGQQMQMHQQTSSSNSAVSAIAPNAVHQGCSNSGPAAKSEMNAQHPQQPAITSKSALSCAPSAEAVHISPAQCSAGDTLAEGGEYAIPEQCAVTISATAVQPSSRPAAAVAPIVQSNSSTSLASDVVLGMTSVTSLSYASTTPAAHKPSQATTATSSGPMASLDEMSNASSNRLRDVLNPETFTIGEADATRIEKRQLREQFKAEGTTAQLPPLNPADPLNCLDAHYWIKK